MKPEEYKPLLRQYLETRGRQIDTSHNPPVTHCFHHDDNNPTAVIYETNLYCPKCETNDDIFDCAGHMIGSSDFKSQKADVDQALSINNNYQPTAPTNQASQAKKSKKKAEPVPMTYEFAKDYFTKDWLESKAKKNGWGTHLAKAWAIYQDGKVIAIDARFEGGSKKKAVITFFYNGTYGQAGAPPFIYGLEKPNPLLLPYVIHEGCKKAEIGRDNIDGFIHLGYTGGSSKASKIDWSILKGMEVYLLPDDDEPGQKAVNDIKKQLPDAHIIPIIPEARKVKESGADIEEWLTILSPEEIKSHILNSKIKQLPADVDPPQVSSDELDDSAGSFPFRVLGMADDGNYYFIGRSQRYFNVKPHSLNQSQMLKMASLTWWKKEFANGEKMSRDAWVDAQDFLVELSSAIDFDPESVRGRGAHKESDGRVSYHDGQNTIGLYDDSFIYLRKTKVDIGLNSTVISRTESKKIIAMLDKLSFETKADQIRCLGWSLLAPFGGALSWRPAILLTGDSSSGKSTILSNIVKKVSLPMWLNASESTPPGVRGRTAKDSIPIVFDEAEDDTEQKKKNTEALFSLMRASTSDDAPDTVKGTKDQGYNSFKMSNMMAFAAISPIIEHGADDNRIFRINISSKHKGKWKPIKQEMLSLMTDENCNKIRALTWRKLPQIIEYAEKMSEIVQEMTKKDHRYCMAESMLSAAFLMVLEQVDEFSEDQIKEYFKTMFDLQPVEEKRNEADELLNRLLDEMVFRADGRGKVTLRECLVAMFTQTVDGEPVEMSQIKNYRKTAENYGLSVTADGDVMIASNHHEISKIIGKGRGYNKIFHRHPNMKKKSERFTRGGKTCYWCLISGVLHVENSDGGGAF